MPISPQSIRKGVKITLDKKEISKQDIISKSENWDPSHLSLFKKMLKQGGRFKIKGDIIEIILQDKILNSKGESDGGVIKTDPFAKF